MADALTLTREQIREALHHLQADGAIDRRMVTEALQAALSLSDSKAEGMEAAARICIDMPQCDGSTYTYWPCVNAIRKAATALRAALQPASSPNNPPAVAPSNTAVRQGWVSVPAEPTEEMVDAASRWFWSYHHMRPADKRNTIVAAYKALIAAAPDRGTS